MAAISEVNWTVQVDEAQEVAPPLQLQEKNLNVWFDRFFKLVPLAARQFVIRQLGQQENYADVIDAISTMHLETQINEMATWYQDTLQRGDTQRVLDFISEAVKLASDFNERVIQWKSNGKYFNKVAHISEAGSLEFYGNSLQNLAVIKAIRDHFSDQIEGNQDEETSWSEFVQKFNEKVGNLKSNRGLAEIFLVMKQGITLNIFIRENQVTIWLGISDVENSLKTATSQQESSQKIANYQRFLSPETLLSWISRSDPDGLNAQITIEHTPLTTNEAQTLMSYLQNSNLYCEPSGSIEQNSDRIMEKEKRFALSFAHGPKGKGWRVVVHRTESENHSSVKKAS